MAKYTDDVKALLELIGGKENIAAVSHCMTRMRFVLADEKKANAKEIEKLKSVKGTFTQAGQYQVIIGPNVTKVYDELCAASGLAKQEAVDENLDAGSEKPTASLTPKRIGKAILDYLSGSMVPLIPVLMTGGLFKALATLLGPSVFNVLPDTDNIIIFFNMLYSACFYFLPIYLGFNAAKRLGATPILGAVMGGILLEPTFAQMAAEGTPFTVLGLPCAPEAYGQTVLPILLSVWWMSLIEKLLKRHIPDVLVTVFAPFVTVLVAAPFALCLFGPIGQWCGTGLNTVLTAAGAAGGIFSVIAGALLAAFSTPLTVTGMHVPVIALAYANFFATGSDNFVLTVLNVNIFCYLGPFLASVIRLRREKERSMALGCLISQLLGGVSEPGIYGLMFRYRKLFIIAAIADAIGGAIMILFQVAMYTPGGPSLLAIFAYMGGSAANITIALVALAATFVVSFVGTLMFGFTKDEIELGPASERA